MSRTAGAVVQVERRIAAPPDIVFSYLVDQERYRQWQGVDAELDPRPGGAFRVTMTGRTGAIVSGVFEEVDAPRRVVFTWGWERREGVRVEGATEVPPGSSRVEITLVADGDDTVLTIRHEGLPTEAAVSFHEGGWNMSIDRLTVVAEGRGPGPNPFELA